MSESANKQGKSNLGLNAREAVFGFVAWLTTQKTKIIMSSSHDAAAVADAVELFCDTNSFPEVSDNWPSQLIHPKEDAWDAREIRKSHYDGLVEAQVKGFAGPYKMSESATEQVVEDRLGIEGEGE